MALVVLGLINDLLVYILAYLTQSTHHMSPNHHKATWMVSTYNRCCRVVISWPCLELCHCEVHLGNLPKCNLNYRKLHISHWFFLFCTFTIEIKLIVVVLVPMKRWEIDCHSSNPNALTLSHKTKSQLNLRLSFPVFSM